LWYELIVNFFRCYHYTESVLHPVYQYCSLFGSRHLRTLTGKFETCARSGAYPFYDGKHFTIQITHSSLSSAANAITMVTVIIKEWGNCTQQKVYEVSSDDRDLMTAFVDGSTFNGNPKRKAVEIIARNDTHVEININHIATNITVMKRGPFLGVSLLIPEDNVQEFATDVETLCRSGCSGGKLMQVKEALVKPLEFTQCHGTRLKTSIKTAANRCAEVGVRDEFFDACVFDLMTSGNDLVTSVELDAQNDIVKRYLPYNTKVNSTSTGRANLSIYHSLSYDHKFSDCIAFVPRPPSSPSSAKRLAKFWSFTTLLTRLDSTFN
uniref:RGM domain family member B n=1 Tax=Syphacia muris TaxID=451379 RepID=A0A0N5AAP1_9BILA